MAVSRWLVSGRVQGVFFRQSTKRKAAELGIEQGHALNTPDGKVDVLAAGSAEQLLALEAWLWVGPVSANVELVEALPAVAVPNALGFAVGRSSQAI